MSARDAADQAFDEGNTLAAAQRHEEALACFDRALAARPAFLRALFNRGRVLSRLGRIEDAASSFAAAVALNPPETFPYVALGRHLQALGRHAGAVGVYDRAIAIDPGLAEAHFRRALALTRLGRNHEALAAWDRVIALTPDDADAHNLRGVALLLLKSVEPGLDAVERALALRPDFAEAWSNLGIARRMTRALEPAIEAFDRAIALDPPSNAMHVNKSACELALGRFDSGWRNFERRMEFQGRYSRGGFAGPQWTGEEPIEGKTILVHAEQGLGETLHFCRYLPLLAARGARVLFAPQPPLARLMRTLGEAITIVDIEDETLSYDYHRRLLSLPLSFATRLETIPGRTPYLAAESERSARWRERLGPEGFKIGICWRGSPGGVRSGRVFPLAALAPIAAIPGVRLISLQTGDGVDQLTRQPPGMRVESLGEEFDAGDGAFLDTAAVMESCDLVITTDTSVAHLAGALDRPTWIALNRDHDWRWMTGRSDTPWYPKTRLFRQTAWGDWPPVFAEMERALKARS